MGLRGAGAMSLFRPPPGPHVHVKYRLTCRKCGRFFVAKRIDAMYCSVAACMQESYRQRKASRQI
jgi:hypothetical protein